MRHYSPTKHKESIVNTNMHDVISQAYQAGLEAGRAAAKQEIAEIYRLSATYAASVLDEKSVKPQALRAAAPTKAAGGPKAAKATKAARAPRTATGPRTKGVKEAIVKHLGGHVDGQDTINAIVSTYGFKANSVRGTLMTMKKSGEASQNGKFWSLAHGHSAANGPMDTASLEG